MRRATWGSALLGAWIAAGAAEAGSQGLGRGWYDGLFAERQHDFGPVPRGAKVRHPFVLTNNTAGPISILNLRVSCGCTSGKASASLVQAGQTAVIEAEMDTRNFTGRKATTLFVTVHNGTEEAEVALNVASTILADIVLNPGGIDFGAVTKGQSPVQTLTIDRVGKPDWKVVKMVSASKVLGASLTETARTPEMVSYRLDVTLKPNTPGGVVRDEIELLTNDAESKGFPVLVTAQVRGDLTATPTILSLGSPGSSESITGRYIVRAPKPFRVTGVEGMGDGFTVTADSHDARPLHVLTVKYTPDATRSGASASASTRQFKIQTDLPGEAPAVVQATVQGP